MASDEACETCETCGGDGVLIGDAADHRGERFDDIVPCPDCIPDDEDEGLDLTPPPTHGARDWSRFESLRLEHESVFGEAAVPQWVKDSLARYVEDGTPTGDCLRAVLANDLQAAFARADVKTARCMAAIVSYVHRYLPAGMRGSYAAVDHFLSECAGVRP